MEEDTNQDLSEWQTNLEVTKLGGRYKSGVKSYKKNWVLKI